MTAPKGFVELTAAEARFLALVMDSLWDALAPLKGLGGPEGAVERLAAAYDGLMMQWDALGPDGYPDLARKLKAHAIALDGLKP